MALEELDFDHNLFGQAANQKGDENLAVRFYTAPIRNDHKSTEAGRPIYDDTEMVEIRVRGDRNNIVQRPVRPDDKRRFRDAYRAYQDGQKALDSGTPLAEWPIASASMVEEMKYLGFFTVEQLAQANDSVCGQVPGLTTLKQKASAYLELAKGAAPIEKLQTEVESQKSRAEAAEAQVRDLAARMGALEAQLKVTAQAPAAQPAAEEAPARTAATAKTR